ncbi:MAG TPA: hypothetical protein VK459_12225, partial [Polyangiaceae bacterium]|nr:hypothetical protein [Polyangiaceae bacterium]
MTQNSSAISASATRPGAADGAPAPSTASSPARRRPEARFDELSVFLRRTTPNGVRMEIRPAGQVTAANEHVLPLFEGWVPNAELVVRAAGVCERAFAVGLEVGGSIVGTAVQATLAEASPRPSFTFEIAVPLRALADLAGKALPLAVVVQPPGHRVALVKLWLAPVAGHGPHIASLDLLESTDSVLFDAPERRLFDLQNPEEGLWVGTGKWRLRLFADWGKTEGEGYAIEARPAQLMHRWQRANDASDLVFEDATRRAGGRRTYAELILDSSHPDLGDVPQEGKDLPLDLIVEHALTFTFTGLPAEGAGATNSIASVCSWHAALPLRLRNPVPLLKTFQRLSAVGIDFGTTSTVAALYHKGYRSLMRLGSSGSKDAKSAEN